MKTTEMARLESRLNDLSEVLQQSLGLADDLHRMLQQDAVTEAASGLDDGHLEAGNVARKPSSQTVTMQVYWIGCGGLRRAAERLGPDQRIDRIGCSVERDLEDRLSATVADAYGSWTHDELGRPIQETGFTRWIMQAIRITRQTTDPAIKVKTRSLEIRLPTSMTRRAFDHSLQVALEPWSLAAKHPRHVRFTNYSLGDADRMSRALELYVGLDPRRDGDRLLGLVEGILASHRVAVEQTQARPSRRMNRNQGQAMRARLGNGYGRRKPS